MIERILLIDDSESDLVYTRIVLERCRVAGTIESCETGPEALRRLQADAAAIDLILLDVNMPGMDGFEFLAACQRTPLRAGMPAVVMLTSSDAPSDRRRAAEFGGVRGFLTKPLDAEAAASLPGLVARAPQ